jgi:CBS domain containing-hemolysin-like protein
VRQRRSSDLRISGSAEALAAEGRAGSAKLLAVVNDPPRYLNLALLLRVAAEMTAAVLVTIVFLNPFDGSRWRAVLAAGGLMVVVSYVAVGVSRARWASSTRRRWHWPPPWCCIR